MSWNPSLEPGCPDAVGADAIETLIVPRARDIGDFEVRRALPAPKRQMVGPFIFFDQAGPAEFVTGQGVDVRPHPHIGLATVTYLYRGEFHHRDSLGSNQIIRPGALNWMVAGRGVTHSERTSAETRRGPHSLFGIQTWVALPEAQEDAAPSFEHHAKEALPTLEADGARLRLILGAPTASARPPACSRRRFTSTPCSKRAPACRCRTIMRTAGSTSSKARLTVAGQTFEAGRMLVFRPGDPITIGAGETGARLLLLGGATLGGPRYIWWNFVASSRERIDAAKEEWRKEDWGRGLFDLPPDDRDEFIPAP